MFCPILPPLRISWLVAVGPTRFSPPLFYYTAVVIPPLQLSIPCIPQDDGPYLDPRPAVLHLFYCSCHPPQYPAAQDILHLYPTASVILPLSVCSRHQPPISYCSWQWQPLPASHISCHPPVPFCGVNNPPLSNSRCSPPMYLTVMSVT